MRKTRISGMALVGENDFNRATKSLVARRGLGVLALAAAGVGMFQTQSAFGLAALAAGAATSCKPTAPVGSPLYRTQVNCDPLAVASFQITMFYDPTKVTFAGLNFLNGYSGGAAVVNPTAGTVTVSGSNASPPTVETDVFGALFDLIDHSAINTPLTFTVQPAAGDFVKELDTTTSQFTTFTGSAIAPSTRTTTMALVHSNTSVWNTDSDGVWSSDANWLNGAPNSPSAVANFDSAITAPRTVTVDGPQTVGTINFNNANSYTVGGAGASAITLSTTAGPAAINVNSGSNTINAPVVLGANTLISGLSGTSLTINGAVSGAFGLIKTGMGSATLTANNTYTGGTTVNGGTLNLNFGAGANRVLSNGSAVVLGGGAINMIGRDTQVTQVLSGLTLNSGNSAVIVTSPSASTETLVLGPIVRNNGAIVDFTLPADGSAITTSTPNAAGTQTILGGYATLNRTTWAVTGPSGGQISPLTNYNPAFVTGADVDVTGAITTPATATTINSLRISGGALNVTLGAPLTITTGGILLTNIGGATITASTITSNSGSLYIDNRSASGTTAGTLAIASQLTGNMNIVVGGDGVGNGLSGQEQVLFSSTANNYVGTLFLNSGRLSFANAAALGAANNPIVVNGGPQGGGQLFSGNIAIAATHAISIAGVGYPEAGNASYGAIRERNTISSPITLIGNARIGSSSGGTLAGAIGGPFELSLQVDGANTLAFTSSGNNWSGGTRLEGGRIVMGATNALPQTTIVTFGTTYAPGTLGGPRSIASPTLDISGFATTIAGAQLAPNVNGASPFSGTATITNSGPVATLTVNSATDTVFGGLITNAGNALSLNKTGTATFNLTGSNSYTGNTTVGAGTLSVLSGGSINNTANIAINSGATLSVASGGAINNSPNTTVNPGGVFDVSASGYSFTNASTLSANGTVLGNITASSPATLAGAGNAGSVTLTGGGNAAIHPGATGADGSVGTLTASTLTVGSGDLRFDLPSTAGYDTLKVTGGATFAGGATISVVPGAGNGTYTILSAGLLDTSASQPTLAQTSVGRAAYSLDFSTPNAIKLTVTGVAANLFWNNAGASGDGTTWDIQNNQNWLNGAAHDQYFEGDHVNFTDANNGHNDVTVAGTVSPLLVTFNNSTGNYTLNGGSIGGNGALTKNGTGSLTINNSNSYTGGSTINAGVVNPAVNGALGNGPVTINGGAVNLTANNSINGVATLNGGVLNFSTGSPINGGFVLAGGAVDNTSGADLNLGVAQTWSGAFNFAGTNTMTMSGGVNLASNASVAVSAATLTVSGAVTGAGGLTKQGPGTLVLSGTNSYAGPTSILAGSVLVNGNNSLGAASGNVTVAGGTLDLTNTPAALNFGVKQFFISGTGAAGTGAIIDNSGVAKTNAFQKITLTGDALINVGSNSGTASRYDIRGGVATLDLGGHTLSKMGPGQFTLVGGTLTGGGVIDVKESLFSFETTSATVGTGSIIYENGANAQFYQTGVGKFNWNLVFKGNNLLGSANATAANINGNITLMGNIQVGPTNGVAGAAPGSNFPLNLLGTISESGGSFGISKFGSDSVTFAGNNSYSGGTSVTAGTLVAAHAHALGTGTLNINGAAVITTPGLTTAIRLPALTMTSATLDLNDNDMILDYTGASPLSTIAGLLQSGYSGGQWNGGNGIISTTANGVANDGQPDAKTGLGIAEATDVGIKNFDGQTISGPAVLIKYTYYGDSSLDGKVDLGNDFNLFLSGFMAGTGNWEIGDYNYDGNVDMTDFTLFLDGYAANGASLGALEAFIAGTDELTANQKASLESIVPEPSSLAVIGLTFVGFGSRRRRR